ncbi:MAG: transcription antitermination factor NusB [Acutalibacteraceae bacterium]
MRPERTTLMTRSQSREQAFALLFEKSFNPETDMEDIITLSLENDIIEPDEFASMLAQTAWDKLFSIDAIIEKYSKNWKKHRISRVALAAMRLSVCELMYIPEVPVGASINEAVELCKKYATTDDASFVNGVLGSVARNEKLADRNSSADSSDGE